MRVFGPETSQAFLRAALDTALDGIVGMDHEGNIIEFSSAAEAIFGYSRQEVLGKPLAELIIPPLLRQRHRDALSRHLETGAVSILGKRLEITAIRSDGEEFPVELTVTRLELDGFPQFTAFIRDITERKRWETALSASQARYQDLFDNAPDLFVVVDAISAKIIECNQTVARALGYTKEDLLGRDILDLYHPDSLDGARRAFRSFVETGEVRAAELQLRRKDGSRIDVTLNVSAVRDEHGVVVSSRLVWRDVSEQKKAEEERRRLEEKMEQAQKLEGLGLLAGGIAHDFNNLLTGILGHAGLALAELSPVTPARENIHRIEAAARRASELCDQMLAYSGRGGFVIEPIDLNQVVKEMVPLLTASISKKARIRYELCEDLPAVKGDITQIRQLVMNLVTNASDAIADETGVITVASGTIQCDRRYLDAVSLREPLAEGNYVFLEVADTGCGMDEETRRKIFDPFFTTKFTGRGLGLAAVLGILSGHHGAVDVQSEPGRGTRFKLLLPVLADSEQMPRKASVEREETKPLAGKILLVDDEETVRSAATGLLEAAGFAVRTATSGPQAIEYFRGHSEEIACVILDLTMPQLDGLETLEELCRIRSDVRVILSSGYNEQEIGSRVTEGGPVGFLKKPYDSEQLIGKLSELLGDDPPA